MISPKLITISIIYIIYIEFCISCQTFETKCCRPIRSTVYSCLTRLVFRRRCGRITAFGRTIWVVRTSRGLLGHGGIERLSEIRQRREIVLIANLNSEEFRDIGVVHIDGFDERTRERRGWRGSSWCHSGRSKG